MIREVLARIFDAPAPALDAMHAAMGRESQVCAAHDAIRTYLDERKAAGNQVATGALV